MRRVTRKLVVPLLGVAAILVVYYADAAYVGGLDPGIADSPLFSHQLETQLQDLKTGAAAVSDTSRPVQQALIGISQGISGCGLSGCVVSGCAGSGCLSSGCGASGCAASGCAISGCGGSACLGSGCGGSGCGGSGCNNSACLGSGCGGSACLGCAASEPDQAHQQPAAAAACPLVTGVLSPGRIVGLQVEPSLAGQQVSWIASGVEVESYRLVRIPAGATGVPVVVGRGAAASERLMAVTDPAGETGASYHLELTDVAGRKLVAITTLGS